MIEKNIYVSRGAYKLLEAIRSYALTGYISDAVCVDIGASTVFAVDVGHDQLSDILKNDARVINMEGVNARYPIDIDECADIIVSDLSHISLLKVLPQALKLSKIGTHFIWLLKPQFEAGLERIGKNGIVDPSLHDEIISEVLSGVKKLGIKKIDIIDSPILGKKGNKEYLIYFVNI